MIVPVILSGGIGSRLWPLSRAMHPKPFIKLEDGQSLIQKTYIRALAATSAAEILTVTNQDLFFLSKNEFTSAGGNNCFNSFILEPFGRNSAAAIAMAAHYIKQKYNNETIMLVLPADHIVTRQEDFNTTVARAAELAATGRLVTFGIKPDKPKTGYGYIETADDEVLRYVEKPEQKQAERYLAAGNFLWNSGMFCMQAGVVLQEYQKYAADISLATRNCLARAETTSSDNWMRTEISSDDFANIENISIDYAIMERSNNISVVPCDIGWSDVGSWEELGKLYPKDKNGNHILGDIISEDTSNCVIHGDQRLIAVLGIKDLIIADTSDALLVADRGQAQQLRTLVAKLQSENHDSSQLFPKVSRPWGNYTNLHEGEGFKLKRIEVMPGAALSLQSHKHRSEHWVVVAGTANVINGDQKLTLTANQSTYIPAGTRHRLSNPDTTILVLIEVQCGNYLGEDDIVRYEDMYGR